MGFDLPRDLGVSVLEYPQTCRGQGTRVWTKTVRHIDEIDEIDYINRVSLRARRRDAVVQTKIRDVEALTTVVQDAAQGLSARALATLVAHPNAVRSALAVAAEALSQKPGIPGAVETIGGASAEVVEAEESERRITARSRPGSQEELLSSEELAVRAGLKTRQSVHDWLKKGRLVGWQGAKRGFVFPAGQLDARGRPLQGLDRIVPLFSDGYAAWVWLTSPRLGLDGASPIALLQKGDIERVVASAKGDVQGDFA